MLRVKTFIQQSKIHGTGLFAAQRIEKGEVTWVFDPEFDVSFTKDQVARMTPLGQEFFWKYCYFDKEIEKFVLCADDQRFINHTSRNPNISSTPRQDTATRVILAGEEMLCDYEAFEAGYFRRRNLVEQFES